MIRRFILVGAARRRGNDMDNGFNVYELANQLSLIVQDKNVSFSAGQVAFCAAFAFAAFGQGFTKEQTKKVSADLIDLVWKDFKNKTLNS